MIHEREMDTFWCAGFLYVASRIMRDASYSDLSRQIQADIYQGLIEHWAFDNKKCRRIDWPEEPKNKT